MPRSSPANGEPPAFGQEDSFDIVAINRTKKLALTNDDRVLCIVAFVDDDGDEVPVEDASYAVIEEHSACYWRIRLCDYERRVN